MAISFLEDEAEIPDTKLREFISDLRGIMLALMKADEIRNTSTLRTA
jgi:hypothetical protein